MAPTRVILMSCGSYNPPTNMHLRMFEIARDHLHRMGTHIVVGGVISPVHDAYAKKELASSTHRCAMLRLALQNSDWIRLSTWETRQNCWTKTRLSLQHHQNLLNAVLFDTNDIKRRMQIEDLDWIPENIKNSNDTTPIQIKLLCGADLLESFGTCDLWAEEDIDAIVGEHGLVVITREGSNPNKFIYDSDILSRHMHNIYIVTEWIPNEVSSSRIRRALKRGESVRYLLQDSVIDYIYKTGIYDAKATTTTTIKLELTSPNANNYLTIDPKYQSTFLTPSPSDVTMESPSPVEIISIDVPDAVLRKNMQNAAPRHCALEEAREKFINAIVAENGNAKHLAGAKAAYPGQAKQIIATESGESRILDEVGPVDEEKKVAKVQPRQLRADVDDESGADVDDESGADVDESGADVDRSGPPGKSDTSADDKQGTPDARRECALSDFSVDKAEYGMREGGALNEEDFDDLTVDEEWRETQERMMKEFAGDGRKNGRNGGVERADVLDDSFGDVSESLSSSRVLLLVGEGSGGEDGAGLDLVDRREGTEFDLIDRREEGTELHLMGRREEGAELHLIDRREEGVGLDLINGREDGAGFDLIDRREDGAGLNLIDRREDRAGFDLIDRREDGAGLNLIDRREDGAGLDLIDRREDGAGFNLVDRREDRAGFDLFDQREDGAGMDLTDRRGDGAELSLINVREEGAGMDLIVRREDGAGLDLIDRREDGAGLDLIVGREERVDLIVGREERVDLIVERQSELTVESEDLVDLIVHQKNHVDFIVEREEPVDIILQRTEQVGLIVDKEDRVDLIVQRKERVDVIVKQNDYTGMIVEREDPVDIVLRRKDFAGVIVERKDPTDLIVRRTDPVDLFVQRRDPVDSIVQRKDAIDLIAHHKDPVDLVVQRKDPVDLIVQRKDPVDLIVQRKDPVESTVQRKNPVDPIVERKDPLDSAVSIVQRKNLVDPTVHGKEPVTSIVQRSPSKDHAAILREQDLLTAIKKATPTHEPEKAAKSSVCKFSPVEESLEPSSSVSDDNTSVKAQSVIDAELLSAKDDFSPDPEELEPSAGDVLPKRDSNLEIDGKYLKSIVNSRKSPRKTKGGQLRAFSDDNVRRSTSGSQDQSSRSEPKTSSVTKTKSDRFEMEKFRSTNEEATRTRVPVSSRIQELAEECDARKIQRYGPLKGSLDSVMTVSETRIIPRRKPKAAKEAFSKKSKSYESFKRVQEAFVEEPLKADSSASQLITANPLDAQTDEFCSVCCYVNQLAMRAEHDEVGSPNQETFYTLQSNCSSLLDEDSTECDICSSWNLQESSTEALDRKIMTAPADEEALYEVCEICGELGAAYDPNQDVLEPPEYVDNRITPPAGLIKSNKDLRFVDECLTDAYVDEDSFEIENCGFQSGTESMEDRGHFPSEDDLIDDLGKDSRPFYLRTASHTPPTRDKHPRDKYFIPKDEVALSNSGGAKKIGRKGSLLKKKIDDTLNAAQDKRRYSSADNLQVAKVFAKGSDKFVRSKGAKLIGSADNIRTSRSSRRCKSLQRSADNVRYIDSSTDNLDSLAESLGKENEFDGSIDWTDRPKVRDNETVKMILTKHGIKIISEKETAL